MSKNNKTLIWVLAAVTVAVVLFYILVLPIQQRNARVGLSEAAAELINARKQIEKAANKLHLNG